MDLGPLVPIAAILTGLGWGWIGYKNRALTVRAAEANRHAADEGAEKQRLEHRVAVLEKIITDGGLQTAAQIEALRDAPRTITSKEKIQ
jgi:hypothetical protein